MNTSPISWYYERIVWLLIGIPIIAVVVRLSILGYSVFSYAGLVADDYYKLGKTILRRLQQVNTDKRQSIFQQTFSDGFRKMECDT